MKINIKLFILCSALLINISSYSQQWISIFNGKGGNFDGSSSTDVGTAVTADNKGNCFVTGYTTAYSQNFDYLTIKYNSNGDTLWTAVYNGESNNEDKAFGIAVDQPGNVYITGYSYSSLSGYDYLTIKYNSSGVQQWAARYNGTGNQEDKAFGIVVDDAGNSYVTGRSTGSSANFDGVTIKYDSDGNEVWSDRYDGPGNGNDESAAITKDKHGYIYITGFSNGGNTGLDYVTIKYDYSNGSRLWLSRYSGNGNHDDKAFGIAVDNMFNVYVTGCSSANNSLDYLTIKYDSDGNELWTAAYDGTANNDDKAFGIAVDNDYNVYVTGESKGINSDFDYLTVKYNSSGSEQWTARYDGTGVSLDAANAIVSSGSSIVVTGTSMNSTSIGSEDMVTIQYDKSTGEQMQIVRYDGGQNISDVAQGIASDTLNNIFITGYSKQEFDYSNSWTRMVTLNYKGKNSTVLTTKSINTPVKYNLKQNYPNPFNPSTIISFDVVNNGIVNLTLYDILGRQVKVLINQNMNAGSYEISFNLSNLSSGVYFYELKAGTFRDVKKMTLIK
jgi:hypothetical protein